MSTYDIFSLTICFAMASWKKCFRKETYLQETTSEDNHKEKIILSVLGSVAFVLLALSLLVGTFVSLETEYSRKGYYKDFVQQFSVPCDDLSLSPDEDFDLFSIKRNQIRYSIHDDGYICTIRNVTEVIQKFVQRIGRLRLSQGLESQPYLQCGNSSLKPASGHLTAAFTRLSRHQNYEEHGLDQTILWDKHPTSAFIAEHLKYDKGKVRVPEGRFYFVYSAVHINISNIIVKRSSARNKWRKISLRICMSSRGHERTLLSKSNIYSTREKNVVSSLSIGSYVFLAKEENIYVKISNTEGLIRDSPGNTFGIFPLY